MIALSLFLLIIFLLLRWIYRPRRVSAYKTDGLLSKDTNSRAASGSLGQKAQSIFDVSSYLGYLSEKKLDFSFGADLNNAYRNIPEPASSPGRTQDNLLNKILDPIYHGNIHLLQGSLSRYISRRPAQQHAAKCAAEETHRCALGWTTKKDVDLFESVSGLVQKTVVRTLMGDASDESSDELLRILRALESDVADAWASETMGWVLHAPSRRLHRNRERVRELFRERLSRRDAAAVAGGPFEANLQDYLTYFLSGRDAASAKLGFASHCTVVMLEAQNSVVANISWVVICLLRHPDVMNAVKRDARAGSGDSVLLQACIRETTRYYAGMERLRRSVQRAGDDEEDVTRFPHPDSWLPGRWINAENKLVDVEEKKHGGCGVRSAWDNDSSRVLWNIVTKQVLSTLLRSYDVSLATSSRGPAVDFEALDFCRPGLPWLKNDLRVELSRRVWPELTGGC
ncbi:hypothetical protein CTRI78_v003085 [Colletotrichum trifolii]|uniref:Uncharacterized protein n=1 Tax=Colletotrichum trifolii TaxID=5466 RepID=A0A4R8RNT9_COLTR|nr:hypothetical protein CTRI78_v003085 [Colletotrichum trifolii]